MTARRSTATTGREQALIASELTYTILRNFWRIENHLLSMDGPAAPGVLAAAGGDAVVAAASRKDRAEALAVVTPGAPEHHSQPLRRHRLHVHRPETLCPSPSVGTSPTSRHPDALRTSLPRSELPPELAECLINLDSDHRRREFSRKGGDPHRLIGRPATGIIAGLRQEH